MDPVTAIYAFLTGLPALILLLVFIATAGGLAVFAFKFLVIKEFLGGFWDLIKDLFALVIPTKWDSAKTIILVGAFSWLVSLFVGSTAQSIIAFVGWIFLIAGVHWVMHEEKELKKVLTINGVFIGPWITGALICYFLFGTTRGVPAIAFILWPCISTIIAGIPKFIGSDGGTQTPIWVKPKPGDRQYLVNLALINLLLSCWIQLGFTTRQWLADYPTLQFADMRNSPFVIQTQSNAPTPSRGVEMLTKAEAQLKANLEGQSWSQVERWLLNFNEELKRVEDIAFSQMSQAKENEYWQVSGRILPGEYNVQLYSIWQGPSPDANGFYFTQTCEISRVSPLDIAGQLTTRAASLPQVGNAKVKCSEIQGPTKGYPEMTPGANQPAPSPR